jgi:hypothetical protein
MANGGPDSSTFTNLGGAVSDLFAGFGAATQANLKAQGLNLNAQGLRLKAQGDIAEGQEYGLASDLATTNEAYTATSTQIQEAQLARSTTMQIGGQKADIAGAGFAESGSALDILRDSASQGALAKATLGQQGLITEAGYKEQADSYTLMQNAANTTAAGEESIADQTDALAAQTKSAGTMAEIGDFVSGALKGVAAVASVALAPATGGLSLAVGPAAAAAMSGTGGLY